MNQDREQDKQGFSTSPPPQGVGPTQAVPEGYAQVVQALDQLQAQVHEISMAMGNWEDDPSEMELHAVMHVDLAKATAAVSQGLPLYNFQELEPTGELVALVDCVLHVMDYCARENVSLAQVLVRKHLHDRRMVDRKRRAQQ